MLLIASRCFLNTATTLLRECGANNFSAGGTCRSYQLSLQFPDLMISSLMSVFNLFPVTVLFTGAYISKRSSLVLGCRCPRISHCSIDFAFCCALCHSSSACSHACWSGGEVPWLSTNVMRVVNCSSCLAPAADRIVVISEIPLLKLKC